MTPIERKARELLPCPFCGNADVGNDEGCFPVGKGYWEVRCGNPSCYAHEQSGATRDEAIDRWNRRTALTPPAGGLPELPEPVAWLVANGPLGPYAMRRTGPRGWRYSEKLFTADQLRAYALAAREDLQAEIDRLRAAGQRVTDAFRALGTAKPGVATSIKHHECEAAMLALDAAIDQARGK